MYHFLETIKVVDGKLMHPETHWQRLQNTCLQYYGSTRNFDSLFSELHSMKKIEGVCKVSIHYNLTEHKIFSSHYKIKPIKKLLLIKDNTLKYNLKYLDRTLLQKYSEQAGLHNDCIIVQNNRITDTSMANIILQKGNEWHTPLFPLLKGTKRQFLLNEKKIIEKDIFISDLPDYENLSLINAMLEPGNLLLSVKDIKLLES